MKFNAPQILNASVLMLSLFSVLWLVSPGPAQTLNFISPTAAPGLPANHSMFQFRDPVTMPGYPPAPAQPLQLQAAIQNLPAPPTGGWISTFINWMNFHINGVDYPAQLLDQPNRNGSYGLSISSCPNPTEFDLTATCSATITTYNPRRLSESWNDHSEYTSPNHGRPSI